MSGQHGQVTVVASSRDFEVVLQAEVVAQAVVVVEVHFPRAAAWYRLRTARIDICRQVITERRDVAVV